MNWQLKIWEPSGETRITGVTGTLTLGRSEKSNIVLKDPTVASEAAVLWTGEAHSSSPFWVKIHQNAPAGHLGDLAIREAHWPIGVPLQVGETKLTIEPASSRISIPEAPKGVRAWKTCSEAGRKILWMAKKAATTPLSIYVAGETGTGKEVLAHLLHSWSDRKSGPFVPLHCGALPLSLAESELFGHVKGAFTGALQHRPGALMQAHNGTLFLDEVGDLPLDIQVKLLRFLENGEIRPVGADRPSRADVRIVCATHHPLQKLVETGKFRRDLYYRLASVTLSIPTLRSRPEDIELLARQFAADLHHTLSPRALLRLQAHCWPGNVRELRHAIERASGLAGSFNPVLNEDAFEFLMTPENISETPELELGASVLSLHEMERVVLLKALKLSHGNRAQAARILGVARSTLFEMLKRHKIVGPRSQPLPQFTDNLEK
jgi:transcriptional regulator with PAS, ATPase and Fis domain